MVATESGVFISETDGTNWTTVQVEGHVLDVQLHPYNKYQAIITATGTRQYITLDRGQNWDPLHLPLRPAITLDLEEIWSFHPTHPDWLLYLGESNCSHLNNNGLCHSEAYFSTDGGQSWAPLTSWVKSCRWSQTQQFKRVHVQGIYCEQYLDQTTSQRLQSNLRVPTRLVFTDNFMESSTVLLGAIVGYAIHSGFLVAAEVSEKRTCSS